jgi:RHS repeat-associated protein
VFDSSGSTVLTPGLAQRSNGVDRFFQEDWIGSARYLTDSTGNAAPSALRFDAFGERTAVAGAAYPTEFQFAAKSGYQTEYQDASDPGLGIVYCQQRYYDPAVGRFISPDPIGFADGLNRYAYADNDPVGAKDPTGTATDPVKFYPNQPHGVRRLEFELFIPAAVVNANFGPIGPGAFAGDGRGPQSDGGTFRIRHSVFLYADGSSFAPKPDTGVTTRLSDGEQMKAPRDGLDTNVTYRDGGWDITFSGRSHDPFVSYAPEIIYSLTFRVTDDGVWFVDGQGTIYPCYELWSYADGIDPSLKWFWDADKSPQGPRDLFKGLYDFRRKEIIRYFPDPEVGFE